jgi:TolA-binding protein
MDLNTITRLSVLLLTTVILAEARSTVAAEPPTPEQALAFAPIQPLIEYSTPPKEEIAQCSVKLERENNVSCWVVTSSKGDVLRRFYDTNSDNYVDTWCYYLNGVEVYRDIDSDFNHYADQYRWFNTAGTRWGIDKNEDKKIDYWKVISPHEVAEQVVLALKTRDRARFELLLLSANELSSLGFGPARTNSIAETIKAAPAAFSKLVAEQSVVTAQTRYADFNSARPGTIPSGTAGSTKDITVCDNATALVATGEKHDQISLGTLVQVADGWRLVDAPSVGGDSQPASIGFLTGPSTPAAASQNAPNEEMQKLMAELERLDKASSAPLTAEQLADNIEQRVTTLEKLAQISPEADRDQWYRQMADALGMAIQSGNYAKGAERLEQLQKKLTEAKADEDLIAHAAFQLMWSQYNLGQHDAKANQAQLQEKWMADLYAFVGKYPKSTDTAEALFQLGMFQEFMGKNEEATKWYQQLVKDFPKASAVEKSKGALRRLNSVGKPLALRGKEIQGGTVDIAKYRGKIVLVHYWGTIGGGDRWKQDLVLLSDVYAKKGGNGFEIIGVCLDDDPTVAKQYISENKIPWKQIYERGGLESRLANEIGVLTLPLMILVDQKGNVANQNVHIAELDSELAKLAKPASNTANALRDTPTSR